jgi:hypothetical protein
MSSSSLSPSHRRHRAPSTSDKNRRCDYGTDHLTLAEHLRLIDPHRREAETAKTQAEQLRIRKEELDRELLQYHNELAEKDAALETLRKECQDWKEKFQVEERANEEWTTEHDKLTAEYNELLEADERKAQRIKELKEEAAEWKTKHSSLQIDFGTLQTKFGALEKRSLSPSPESEVKRLKKTCEDWERRYSTELEKLKTAENEKQILARRLTTLEPLLKTTEAEKAAAKKKLLEIQGENDTLSLKVEQLEEEVKSRPTSTLPDAPSLETLEQVRRELGNAVQAYSQKDAQFKAVQRRNQTLRNQVDGFRSLWEKVTGQEEGDFKPETAAEEIGDYLSKRQEEATVYIRLYNALLERGIANTPRRAEELTSFYLTTLDAYLKPLDLGPLQALHPSLHALTNPKELASGIVECVAFSLSSLWQQLPHAPEESLLTPQTRLETLLQRIESATQLLKTGPDQEKEELRKQLARQRPTQQVRDLQALVQILRQALGI